MVSTRWSPWGAACAGGGTGLGWDGNSGVTTARAADDQAETPRLYRSEHQRRACGVHKSRLPGELRCFPQAGGLRGPAAGAEVGKRAGPLCRQSGYAAARHCRPAEGGRPAARQGHLCLPLPAACRHADRRRLRPVCSLRGQEPQGVGLLSGSGSKAALRNRPTRLRLPYGGLVCRRQSQRGRPYVRALLRCRRLERLHGEHHPPVPPQGWAADGGSRRRPLP